MLTAKRAAALYALVRRLQREAIAQGRTPLVVNQVRAILDRLHFTADEFPLADIKAAGEFSRVRAHRITPKPGKWMPYTRISILKNNRTGTRLSVLSAPRSRWLRPFRYEFLADDSTGIRPQEVFSLLQFLRDVRLSLVEVAFDFPLGSTVDEAFILRHARFGKCQPSGDNLYPTRQTWGSRQSGKFIRTYFKGSIGAHRIEFELRTRFLKTLGIRRVDDFQQLAAALAAHHFEFKEIDLSSLATHLRRQGRPEKTVTQIIRGARERQNDLGEALSYLRLSVGLTNVHRLLRPMQRENAMVRTALARWAEEWRRRKLRLNP